jgi:uncharacterized protein YcnI
MKYKVLIFSLAAFFLFAAVLTASAHVVVKPNTAGIGAFQIFTMGVPSEKPIATVSLRLMLPDGLNFVTPNVKPGWKVEVKTRATGKKITDDDGMTVDEMKPVEIDWTGGSVPAGQRDEFSFQAQVPATPATLVWKAYQTYQDGSVISWDQDPSAGQPKDAKGNNDFSKVGPFSRTNIVDDLSASRQTWWALHGANATTVLSVIAIILAGYAVMKKKTV